jgi:acetate kinase
LEMDAARMTQSSILVLNSGSSSIKFSVWSLSGEGKAEADSSGRKLLEGEIEGIGSETGENADFWIKSWMNDEDGAKVYEKKLQVADASAAFARIAEALGELSIGKPAAVGHRMVCGGPTVVEHQRITPELIAEMERYVSFAPLHAPGEIRLMRESMRRYADVPNFVCLDSRFHRDLPAVARELPIAEEWRAQGLRRFGAHGLSYEWIATHLGAGMPKRVIAAHLGNGASVCALRDGKSVDTSMGLTPTGGILSGSRTGDLDPGVMLYLLREMGKSEGDTMKVADVLEAAVNRHAGLAGVSGLSNDMRALREAIERGNTAARLAVDEFVYVLRKCIGAYAMVLGGVDLLVFTGGIGEHDAATRAEVCAGMEWLGVRLDAARNMAVVGEAVISAEDSAVRLMVIPAEEDRMIARHVRRLMQAAA